MRSRTQLLIAFFSAMAVTLVAVTETGRTSPGTLARVHGREDDLSGRNDCSECHGGLFGTMREACLECHAQIVTQLETSTGLHGTLGARAEQCGLCHAEHHGEDAPLVHGQSFALAGAKQNQFDHLLVGLVLDGAHTPLECSECHQHAGTAVLPRGETRFLGLDRDCASCHEDPHEGRMAVACVDCHGQQTWDGLAAPDHARVLPLVGGHGDLACAQCHAADGPRAFEIVAGKGERPPPRNCVACHESPHAREFAAGVAELVELRPGKACVTCHLPEHETFHEPALLDMTAEQHAASGFPLVEPHVEIACDRCHDPARGDFAARYPGRGPEQCSACHADVHEGQFASGPFAGQECTACHEPTRFEPHTFTAERHALAALDLTGRHLEIECVECHERPDEEAARVFRGTPALCDACHTDAHDAFFAPFLADYLAPEHGECEHCHDTTSFASGAADFDHAAFTGFAVLGAHQESECAVCHEASAEPDAAGRTFGRVAEVFAPSPDFSTGSGCVACHADPHGGHFDTALGFPAEVEARRDCARCHVETSFRAMPRAFDHGFWTGFALVGAHERGGCSACHAPFPGAKRLGRSTAEALGAGCADCHEDPHAGQFAVHAKEDGRTDCARCHDPAREDFVAFDHERDARFALGEAHMGLECAACHATTQRDGLAVVHYRPLGSECVDCHGNSAEVLLRRQPRKR